MGEPNVIPAASAAGAGKSRAGWRRPWRWMQRTPVRTFVIYPAVVIVFECIRHGGVPPIVPWGAPLLIWGYLQYRLVGRFRGRRGGGGPGLDLPPQQLVRAGPYRYTRNPMYLGHLIFMSGLALTFWSWLALAILLVNAAWFHVRVRGDEINLLRRFGAPYAEYCREVRRWIPGII